MTQAVCFNCGTLKWGAFNNCDKCGSRPKSDDELMLSIMLTDHHFTAEKLAVFGAGIRAGKIPQIPESERVKLRPAIDEAKVLLGLKPSAQQDSGAASQAKVQLFYSSGLTWPFLAAVAALVIAWTLYFGQSRFVRQSEVLTYGVVFGLLSGVVVFAIMRAFDRGRAK